MPQLEIRTNLRLSQIPANFNQKATEMVATMLSKPPEMTMASKNLYFLIYSSCQH